MINFVPVHRGGIEVNADPSGVLFHFLRERDFAKIVNEGGFANTDGAHQKQDFVAQRGKVLKPVGNFDGVCGVFNQRGIAKEGGRGIANNAVNFTDVAVLPG